MKCMHARQVGTGMLFFTSNREGHNLKSSCLLHGSFSSGLWTVGCKHWLFVARPPQECQHHKAQQWACCCRSEMTWKGWQIPTGRQKGWYALFDFSGPAFFKLAPKSQRFREFDVGCFAWIPTNSPMERASLTLVCRWHNYPNPHHVESVQQLCLNPIRLNVLWEKS